MPHAEKERFITLDVFRGITVCLMILVNTPGSGAMPFPCLMHADWNGFTLTDLVFPSFLFAAGNAMSFSRNKDADQNNGNEIYKILKRTILIFIVGYFLTWYCSIHWDNGSFSFQPFRETRIMAVLQRIALAYCLAAFIVHFFSTRKIILISAIILLSYWIILYVFGDAGIQYSQTGNAVRKLDLLLMGKAHMYIEKGIVFDPEGILSTFPAVVNVLAGYLAGKFIIRTGKNYETVARLQVAGSLLIICALIWDYYFPFNKKLWTSSYVFLTIGIDLVAIGILLYVVEIKKWQTGIYFFQVFGKNPLFIYVFSNLFIVIFLLHVSGNMIFFDWINLSIFQKIAAGPVGSLLFAVCFTFLCWGMGWILDKRKIYIRL